MILKIKKRKKTKWLLLPFILVSLTALSGWLVWEGHWIPNEMMIGRAAVIGVDVSHYQGTIDWAALAQQNISFAFIKATEGSGHVDEKFACNWEQAGKTDLKLGAYHFFSFESSGEEQAEHFIRTMGKRKGQLPPVIDIEFYGQFTEQKPDADAVRAELTDCLSILEAKYGVKPILYATGKSYAYFIKGGYEEYPLWIRSVLLPPQIGREWEFWQYTDRKVLDGYAGTEKYIDMNVFRGTEAELDAYIHK